MQWGGTFEDDIIMLSGKFDDTILATTLIQYMIANEGVSTRQDI